MQNNKRPASSRRAAMAWRALCCAILFAGPAAAQDDAAPASAPAQDPAPASRPAEAEPTPGPKTEAAPAQVEDPAPASRPAEAEPTPGPEPEPAPAQVEDPAPETPQQDPAPAGRPAVTEPTPGPETEPAPAQVEDPAPETPQQDRVDAGPTVEELFARYEPATVLVQYTADAPGKKGARTAHLLGVVVSADGLVAMPGHVQLLNTNPRNLKITVGEDKYDAELLRRAGQLNVTYARILPPKDEEEDAPVFAFVEFTDAPVPALGDPVWVFGLLPDQAGFGRRIRRQRIAAKLPVPVPVYALDGTPHHGENGGLVLAADGRPVGVLGYELSKHQGGDLLVRHSIPLIFPAAQLLQSMAEPREAAAEAAAETEAWFGILIQPMTKDLAKYLGDTALTGCIISNVVADSPAAAAGLRRRDIITEYEGVAVDVPNDLALLSFTRSIRALPIGSTVNLKYLRDGDLRDASVVLAALPKTAAKASTFEQPAWGVRVRELTKDIIYLLNLPLDLTGVVVDKVEQGGPARAAGLAPGDVLLRLNGEEISSLADYQDSTDQLASTRPDKIVLFLMRGTHTTFAALEPDWRLPARK